ncbi:MAG TPA: glycosyltransferase [Pirellulales bacterium]|nr:glycosyltransferase [Pirellulales bacterium]
MNLIIADETLENFRGHSFEYSRSVYETAAERGYPCTTLTRTCVSTEIADQIAAIPCFTFNIGHTFRLPLAFRFLPRQVYLHCLGLWNQWVHGRMMLHDLKQAQPQLDLNAETIVIAPTVYFNQIIPFVEWAEQLPVEQCPQFALVLHSSAYPQFTDTDHWERLYRRAFARLERSRVVQNFHLFTDAEDLVDEFQDYTRLSVHLAPIPHSGGVVNGHGRSHCRDVNQPIRITYLGDSSRRNKGFRFFGGLFHRLRPYFESGQIVAEIQASLGDSTWQDERLSLARLHDRPGITVHDGPMGTDGYYGLLDRADIVVLPYTTETYHSQTSGVFSEAVAHGKPVVVPRGTWMARQLKKHAVGVTFIPEDPQSLHEAVVDAIDRYHELSDCAARRAVMWSSRHCVPAYLDTIFKTVGVA